MVQINFNFNAADVAPASGFEPLPAGEYVAFIEDSEEKKTRAGDGSYLQFTFRVVDGPHANHKLWARLNTTNPSEEAQRIGRSELSALCRAVGVLDLHDTGELHNKPLRIRVVQEKRKDTGEMANRIKSYEQIKSGAAVPGLVQNGSSNPAAQPPAWMR